MSFFITLPKDLQREILLFVSDKDLSKIESSILDDNDIFWKLRAFGNNILTQKDVYDMYQMMLSKRTDKNFCLKFGNYQDYIRANQWSNIMDELIDDEVFLKNYIDAKDNADYTLLLIIIWCYWQVATKYNVEELVEKLVKNGADINYRHPNSQDYIISPYEMAIMKKHTKIIKIFEASSKSKVDDSIDGFLVI